MLINIVSILALFSIVILVHEFGHFWVAKRSGIRVETFSLGFGPKIFSWRRGETVYQVCFLLFGGFVKMSGEDYDDKKEFDPREYMGKPPGIRALVVASGAIHNLLLGFLLLIPAFMIGVIDYDGTRIGSFVKEMPAERAGIRVGDEIVSINGMPCRSWLGWFDVTQNIKAATAADRKAPIVVVVKRGPEIRSFTVVPRPLEVTNLSGKKETAFVIGILPTEMVARYGPAGAVRRASVEFVRINYGIYVAFKMLFTRQISAKLLSGPVGIAKWGAEIAHLGIAEFMRYLALISINLGIVNLFPIPFLDGGHLVGLLGERVTRIRPKKRLLEIVQYVGVIALLMLAFYVTYNDIIRILEEQIKK